MTTLSRRTITTTTIHHTDTTHITAIIVRNEVCGPSSSPTTQGARGGRRRPTGMNTGEGLGPGVGGAITEKQGYGTRNHTILSLVGLWEAHNDAL